MAETVRIKNVITFKRQQEGSAGGDARRHMQFCPTLRTGIRSITQRSRAISQRFQFRHLRASTMTISIPYRSRDLSLLSNRLQSRCSGLTLQLPMEIKARQRNSPNSLGIRVWIIIAHVLSGARNRGATFAAHRLSVDIQTAPEASGYYCEFQTGRGKSRRVVLCTERSTQTTTPE